MASASASADGIEMVIVPPTERPQAGAVAEFSVYVHNRGEGIASAQLPVQVSCRIESGDETIDVVAKALEPFDKQPVVLGKNGSIKGRYAFTVPTGLSPPHRRVSIAEDKMYRAILGSPFFIDAGYSPGGRSL